MLAEVKSGNKSKPIICHNCKGKGHRKNVCPSKQVAKAPTAYSAIRAVSDNSGIAWVSKAGVHDGVNGYVIDSGANVHVTHNKDHLRDWEAAAGELTGVGIGSLPIHGKGTVVFVHPDTEDQMVVKNVLYVPDIAQNLISSKYFTANGGKIMFNSDSVWHAGSNSTEMIKVGTLNNTLYSFDFTPLDNLIPTVYLAQAEVHAKLGHPSSETMKYFGYKQGPKTCECSACSAGKVVKRHPRTRHSPISNFPLQLIHSDIAGPFSYGRYSGEQYFLTIIDDCTMWCHIVPYERRVRLQAC